MPESLQKNQVRRDVCGGGANGLSESVELA